MGRIFDLCVEKGSELPKGHKARYFKGRVVYQGNQVKDEYGQAAIFNELSSSPSSMEASKAADAFGMHPGADCQLSDAEQAYTQSKLKGLPMGEIAPRPLAQRVG